MSFLISYDSTTHIISNISMHPWDVTSSNEHSLIDDLLLISSTLSWQIRFWCPKPFSLGIEILIPSTCCWQNNSTPRLNFFQSLDLSLSLSLSLYFSLSLSLSLSLS